MKFLSSHYQKATFLLSAAEVKQLPPDSGVEVAIVGRSNAGKSSVLNRITRNKSLARVSKTPGRTQLLNVFVLDDMRRLIDLPGYGYAKAPLAAKHKWEKIVNTYIEKRKCLHGLVVVMDCRHPLRDLDIQLLAYCDHRGMPVHILLNKADKLSRNAQMNVLREVREALCEYKNKISIQIFSAMKGTGMEELYEVLDDWYKI